MPRVDTAYYPFHTLRIPSSVCHSPAVLYSVHIFNLCLLFYGCTVLYTVHLFNPCFHSLEVLSSVHLFNLCLHSPEVYSTVYISSTSVYILQRYILQGTSLQPLLYSLEVYSTVSISSTSVYIL